MATAAAALMTAQAHAQTIPPSIANAPGNNAAPAGPQINQYGSQTDRSGGTYTGSNVLGRARPGLDALGIDLGAFNLYPSLNVNGFYDSNIYALSSPQSDGGIQVSPQLRLVSKWARSALTAQVQGTANRFVDHTIENNASASALVDGRLDVDGDTQLFTTVSFARRIQQRGTEDEALIGLTTPVAYGELDTALNGQRRFGDLLLNVGATASRVRYEDAKLNNQVVSLRDDGSRSLGLTGRLQYQIGPGIGVFVAGTYNDERYVASVRFPDRSSTGYTVLSGVAFGVTRLLVGELGLGYIKQNFASSLYSDVSGLDYSFKLNWGPTPLIDVHANVGRSFQRSALIGAAGIQLDTANVNVDYELFRNLLLNGGLTYTVQDFRGFDLRDRREDLNFSARYLANRYVSLFGTAVYSSQQRSGSSPLGRNYNRAVISAGARLAL